MCATYIHLRVAVTLPECYNASSLSFIILATLSDSARIRNWDALPFSAEGVAKCHAGWRSQSQCPMTALLPKEIFVAKSGLLVQDTALL